MGTRRHHSSRQAEVAARRAAVAGGGALVVLALSSIVVLVALHRADNLAGHSGTGQPTAGHTGQRSSGSHDVGPPPPPALRLESTSPASGADDVVYAPTVTVQLSSPLAAGSPLPSISPEIPGTWTAGPDGTLVFHPQAQFAPWTTVRVTVPGGAAGVRGPDGALLPATEESTFTVEGGSVLRLQQLLAELGYLPVSFAGDASGIQTESDVTGAPAASTSSLGLDSEPTSPALVPLTPEPGRFVWRYAGTPSLLRSQWSPGTDNVVTRGAVMAFEAEQGLTVDGEPGPAVWNALLQAVAARRVDPAPYDYISVSESLPETITVWEDGSDILRFPANTGISVAPTAKGTYPVYARYLVTTMSGKNPNGTVYHDPGIPHVAYFNGGDAIHGYIRASYGFPQSLGCVELSYADAGSVWPYDQLGTLVTVY